VASALDSRVDESCGLHLRFDKQAALQGRLELSSCGDVIDVRIRILAFPARHELAVRAAAGFLDELIRGR
jgi:RNA binding exosome subunit